MMFRRLVLLVPAFCMVSALAVDLSDRNVTAEEFLRNPDLLAEETQHERRQGLMGLVNCIPITKKFYTLVGDGNPHQNFRITELGGTMITCPSGAVSKSYSHETGWSIDGKLSAAVKGFEFASLGFQVEDKHTVTNTITYNCAVGNDQICILSYQAVTAVTVDFWEANEGCSDNTKNHLGRGIVYLPNASPQTSGGSVLQKGVNHAAVNRMQCRGGTDDRTVAFNCGPPGGANWFDTRGPGITAAYLQARVPANCPIPIEAYKWS